MTQPTWTTPAGKIASVNEREAFSKQLKATLSGQANQQTILSLIHI